MDYAMPRADDLPDFITATDETQPCTHNPSGVKGCGESGTIGAPAAITSAMIDALGSVGVTGVEMPYTPTKVWHALNAGQRQAA
jgi:carbon-monoxide dehydrogenase large subunit